jgi:hypothetical protein
MKLSIDKELEKRSKEHKKNLNIHPIQEVHQLLLENETEHARILRGLSANSQFNRVEKIRTQQLELERHETNYEGKVYTKEQIKNLCIDYHLRFLQSRLYTGSYDIEVAAKIREFAVKTNSPIDDFTLGRRFFVLAPAKMFELRDEKYVTKKQLDPAIFFQIDNDHYRMIHKWGSDFTIFRLLEGFKWRNWWTYQLTQTMFLLPIVTFIMFYFAFEPATIINHFFIGIGVNFIIAFFFACLIFGIHKQDKFNEIKEFFSKYNWNNDSKIRN